MKRNTAIILFTTSLLSLGSAEAGFDDMLRQGADLLNSGATGSTNATAASALPTSEIDAGLKEALSIGAERAIDYLSKPGGFLNDPKVRIGLPGSLGTIAQGLRAAGQGAIVDEFEETMNRAAEAAIPRTLDIVKETVSNMTLDDARQILSGGDDAATQYLRRKAGPALAEAIKPIVAEATDKAGATAAYKKLVGSAGGGMLGNLMGGSSLDLDSYVTDKTLDGLFTMLAEEERKIRTNPMARTTDLLKKVFGK
ncbi:MAG: DUF4197 domain-containing protein [Gammaproteobacteria bacterium]|nr:MAG: DUF4197 domain-containing protein [Gammaproteobacteria bacterium]RTZ77625.1 MAG: DUF4197 domain-containing protein [Gammaproteobacteria bacterium]